MNKPHAQFPGGSKSRVNRAGAHVREDIATSDDLTVVDEWRAAHRAVLNTFQALLRWRTRGTDIVVAQRHKRKRTIFDKLHRLPKMELSRMDDVAGCRLIFPDLDTLHGFRSDFHDARFHHKLRNDVDKYDYIARPKETGYRGIHDVYSYDVNSFNGRPLKGLLIELQYRTLVQHAWATAVEVLGFITESQPKFQRGDKRLEIAMSYASEVLARSAEGLTGPHPDESDEAIVREFIRLERDLSLLKPLRGLNAADKEVTSNRNAILSFSPAGELEVTTYRDAPEALRALFAMEQANPDSDIVLVRADTSEDVRLAFRNYFSDARDFIELVERGCERLSGRSLANLRKTGRGV